MSQLPGVVSADLNFASGVLLLEYESTSDPRGAAVALVKQAGHGVEPLGGGSAAADIASGAGSSPAAGSLRAWWSAHRAESALAAGAGLIAAAWLLGRLVNAPPWSTDVSYLAAVVASGTLTWRRAFVSLRARSVDMNVLMSIAVLGALAIGEWGEAASVIWLFALGGYLEARSLARTHRSISDLVDLTPPVAHVLRDGVAAEVPLGEVMIGATLLVKPGERVPLDGVVSRGASAVDESPITGESTPQDKEEGDRVFAGSLATSGALEVVVTAVAADSTLARIVYLVEEAQASRAPAQRLVDRFTRFYTPVMVALAAGVAIVPPAASAAFDLGWGGFSEWLYRGLVVLIVSCPCALVISTPVAIVSAISRAARDGVLVKGGAFIELAARVRAVAFDKTGTLTRGVPELADIVRLGGASVDRVLAIAGAIETRSAHPIARALVRAAAGRGSDLDVEGFSDDAGRGVRGTIDGVEYRLGSTRAASEVVDITRGDIAMNVALQESEGRTVLLLLGDGEPLALFGVADAVRSDARRTVSELRGAGIGHVVLLTGDNERTAAAVAAAAGITEHRARLLPEDKTASVAELRGRWRTVAMVGDGINDAPALASADIGIAMGAAGSATALETADVALMADDIAALPGFFRLGRRTQRVIVENVVFSIAVKVVVLVLALFGIAQLWLAVFADMGVSLIVIANGLRLLGRRRPPGSAVHSA